MVIISASVTFFQVNESFLEQAAIGSSLTK